MYFYKQKYKQYFQKTPQNSHNFQKKPQNFHKKMLNIFKKSSKLKKPLKFSKNLKTFKIEKLSKN